MSNDLTPKQALFVQEYLIDLNATQAAVRAGYSAKTAYATGAENLKKPQMAEAIQRAQVVRSETTRIDQTWIVVRAVEVAERCLQHRPVFDRKGERVMVETPDGEEAAAYTFDAKGAVAALSLLAKHTGGFNDRIEHTGAGGGPIEHAVSLEALARLSPEERENLRQVALKLEGKTDVQQ